MLLINVFGGVLRLANNRPSMLRAKTTDRLLLRAMLSDRTDLAMKAELIKVPVISPLTQEFLTLQCADARVPDATVC